MISDQKCRPALPFRWGHCKGKRRIGARHRPLRAGSQATRGTDRRGNPYRQPSTTARGQLRSLQNHVSCLLDIEPYALILERWKVRHDAVSLHDTSGVEMSAGRSVEEAV